MTCSMHVEERDVGAGAICKCSVASARSRSFSRSTPIQVLRLRLLDPPEENRMSPSGVAASDEDDSRIDVLVAGGRRVRAERLLVARRRGRLQRRELVSMLLVPIRPLASC